MFGERNRPIDPIVSPTAVPPAPTVADASPVGSTPANAGWFAAGVGGIGGTPAQAGACADSRLLRERLTTSPG